MGRFTHRINSYHFLLCPQRRRRHCDGTQYRSRRLYHQAICNIRSARPRESRPAPQHGFQAVAAPQEKDIYEPDIVFKDLRIDQNEKLCFLGDQELALTKTEFDLLQFFLSHRNRIYSREEIIQQVWAKDMVVTNRAIDTNIARLRKKLASTATTS